MKEDYNSKVIRGLPWGFDLICNSEVTESTSSKLLGMIIDNDLKWKGHIYGKGGVLSSLNQRLFTRKRLSNPGRPI